MTTGKNRKIALEMIDEAAPSKLVLFA